jgi:hypothetical protein
MDIAATRGDAKSFTYMDNFRQAMQRCGEVYLSMGREVYVEEGRTVETLGDDGEEGEATLVEGVTDDMGRFSIRHDLAKGKYNVISDVTEATATRRDKTVKTCLNGAQIVAAFDPELAGALVSTAYMNVDGEGIENLQAWLRQRAIRSGLVKPNDEEAQQLQQEQANAQPDPQSAALQAVAEKESALATKAVADTKLSGAKTILTLAQAEKVGADTEKTDKETEQVGKEPMLDPGRPRIKKGYELEQAA